ncbi:MAG: HAD family hydrolase, partial [Anaerolineae bacterium]|nr:HAD family hydrolase [Anaerolineae bacterium]
MIAIPDLGHFGPESGLKPLAACSDGRFRPGADGVVSVTATGDGKVEFIAFADHTLAYVRSALGYPAYYPVRPVALERPVRAVLMDLDGTSVRSERFWIWIIEQTTAGLLGNPRFTLEEADLPHVSGHSVSEHLAYCIRKYCPDRTVEDARALYFELVRREMREILGGRGRADAFTPAPGLKEFLLALKAADIKIALVTSGLYEKAYPEIVAAFRTMQLGDPAG